MLVSLRVRQTFQIQLEYDQSDEQDTLEGRGILSWSRFLVVGVVEEATHVRRTEDSWRDGARDVQAPTLRQALVKQARFPSSRAVYEEAMRGWINGPSNRKHFAARTYADLTGRCPVAAPSAMLTSVNPVRAEEARGVRPIWVFPVCL